MQEPVEPKWRTAVGMLLILAIIMAWAIAVLLLAPFVRQLPFLVELIFYAVAGIGWIFPVRPLLSWMAK